MESILMKALQLIAALSFLVIIHEFGHYIIARSFGIKVEKFYLFFNPWFSLFKWKPKKGKVKLDANGNERPSWRDTEYGIGWLPLGGYVKIAGMIDESMDKAQLEKPAESWEFRSKPAYQRLLVMLGGVIFNFILAILIYAGIAFYWGQKYVPFESATEGMDFTQLALDAGFRNGDIPLTVDGKAIDASQEDFPWQIATAKVVTVLRNHKDTVIITMPENFVVKADQDAPLMQYRQPVYVKMVQPGSAADKAGLREGDHIVAIDDTPTPSFTELTPALMERKGREISISAVRDNKTITLKAELPESGKLGFQLKPYTEVYPSVVMKYGLLESIPKGIKLGTGMLTNYVSSMKYVVTTKEGAQSVGGFGAIGNMFPDRWNWYSFWEICAFLSVALAFMNILPIPALDGGHAAFLVWEIVTRRKPSDKVIEYAQIAGMCFLFLLLIYANGADIVRAILK